MIFFFPHSDVWRLRLCCDHLRTKSFCSQKAEQPAGTCYCVVKRIIWTDLTHFYKLKLVPSHWNSHHNHLMFSTITMNFFCKKTFTPNWGPLLVSGVFDLNLSKLMCFLEQLQCYGLWSQDLSDARLNAVNILAPIYDWVVSITVLMEMTIDLYLHLTHLIF